jgi:hypothetical protein
VVFRDSGILPYEDGAEAYLSGSAIDAWQALRERFKGITLKRLFTTITPARLDELTARALRLDPKYPGVDLKIFFAVDTPAGLSVERLAEELMNFPGVVKAYVESGPTPPPTITVDARAATQRYLEAAPAGIGAMNVWNTVSGAAGENIKVVDLEQGWWLDHEDLPPFVSGATPIGGLNQDYQGHGLAVLGVLLAEDNDKGCVGIVPRVKPGLVSVWQTGSVWNISTAVISAVDWLEYGDVLLIEATVRYTVGGTVWGNMPVETEYANFVVIQLATALGITVIEAAGNMGHDLDTFSEGGQYLFARDPGLLLPGFRDSGAILVAASMPGPANATLWMRLAPVPGRAVDESNYGSRIDCFAQGVEVGTIGLLERYANSRTDYLPDPAKKPLEFSGTSAASAIVAGAAVSAQGMVHAATGGQRLSARQMRIVLSDDVTGTASQSGRAVDKIGVMPDLETISASLPDLVIRDFAGDTGDPHNGPLARSPDIIVRRGPVANAALAYGEASSTVNDETLSEDVLPGQDHYIYVRLRNRGSATAAGARASVYWSEPATLVTPKPATGTGWTLIGEVAIGNVVNDNKLNVSPAIAWPAAALPPAGHYCFVALVGDPMDPMPWADDFSDWAHYLRFIRDVNNATWRNFNVVAQPGSAPSPTPSAAAAPAHELPFWLTGPERETKVMSLEILTIPATGCTLSLDGPEDVVASTKVLRLRPILERIAETAGITPRRPVGRMRLGNFPFPAGYRRRCRLSVRLSERTAKRPVDVIVRQLYEKIEVGRITWRLLPRK